VLAVTARVCRVLARGQRSERVDGQSKEAAGARSAQPNDPHFDSQSQLISRARPYARRPGEGFQPLNRLPLGLKFYYYGGAQKGAGGKGFR
jgi:hypothetical protein